MCAIMWCHLVKVTEVTAGLAESNGILLPGDWHKFTCWLTACTPGSAPGAMLGHLLADCLYTGGISSGRNKYGRTLPFYVVIKCAACICLQVNMTGYYSSCK